MSKQLIACWALLLTWTVGCASVNLNPTTWEMPTVASEDEPPGTPEWWKKNKSKAEFVPRQGFQVAGAPGYYDRQGRPINSKVAKQVQRPEEESGGLFEDVGISESVAELKTQAGFGPDEQLAKDSLAAGELLLQQEKYDEAAKEFKKTIARWPNSQLEQDARFLLGECYFYSDQYDAAIKAYEALLQAQPNTRHLDKIIRRQFDVARYWEQHHQHEPHWATTPNLFDEKRPLFDTLGNAIKVYENIRLNDPTGPLADAAVMATANSHFLRGRYDDADYHYQLLRNEYPRSEHQYEAHVLGLQCKLRMYQGADYDGTPLLDAKKLVKQLKVQFARELDNQERERLVTISGQLKRMLAERDLKMAKYYDDTEYYGAAKYYYANVVRDYPNTPIAEQALARYREIEVEPEVPETKFEWLVGVFPENAERKAIADIPMLGPQLANQPQDSGPNAESQTILR